MSCSVVVLQQPFVEQEAGNYVMFSEILVLPVCVWQVFFKAFVMTQC